MMKINDTAKYVKCNLCGNDNYHILQQDGEFNAVRCRSCNLVYVNPQPDVFGLYEHYDDTYYAPWLHQQSVPREKMWQKRLKKIKKYVKRGRLLDVGCACGAFLNIAREDGWAVYGTEVSSYASCYARDNHKIDVSTGELHEAGYSSDYFDVVTMWHVLEHSTDPVKVLSEIKRILRPGGVLIVAVPNVQNFIYKIAYTMLKRKQYKYFSIDDREIHLYHFSIDTLRHLMKKSGLIPLRAGLDTARIKFHEKLHDILAGGIYKFFGINLGLAIEVHAKKEESK